MSSSTAALGAPFGQVLRILVRHEWVQVDVVDVVARVNKTLRAVVKRQKLWKLAVRISGFPAKRRISYWLRAGDVKTLMKKSQKQLSSKELYMKLAGIDNLDDKATLEMTGVEGEISRDIERTFPANSFFSGEGDGRRLLGNVLKATAAYESGVGYCQGMNYVVAALLFVAKSAEEASDLYLNGHQISEQEVAFWLTISLIRRKGMADMWKHEMPGLPQCFYVFQRLLKKHFYDLSVHFQQIGMHSSIFVTQWFVTLFARVLPVHVLVRVWDVILVDGWKTVYRVAIAIIAELQPILLTMDLDQCSNFFRRSPALGLEESFSATLLVQQALDYKVTRSSLKQLEEERHLEYLRLRLQQAPLSDEHRVFFPLLRHETDAVTEQEPLDLIRFTLQRFDKDVASDTVVLQHKIEAAERAYAQAMSTSCAISHEYSVATSELNECIEVKNRLLLKFRKLMTTAIREATSSSTGSSRSRPTTWIKPLDFINRRMAHCLERLPVLLNSADAGGKLQSFTIDDEEDEEVHQNLKHLDILVPQLAAELRLVQRALAHNQQLLRPLVQRTRRLQSSVQFARVEVEEAHLFKDRLTDQLLHIISTSEQIRNERMQQLFAEVDRD
ncbi:unnamed protein product [Hyaloperonospora brassicae]|uniref:Rab-GAP TBC domain-containing protein n=1 Tax=Hyaloperonospora brassicae TaxID=162125 RepID=A0AAV0TL96_HYABA|nr:unnamed protein product [Hyaloperonospora brassicae]